MNVVEAAISRVQNAFNNGVRVYLSFSAGKDSLCMSYIVYSLIRQGKINPEQLTVIFIDEEALYPSMEQMAIRWYKRFKEVGAEFRWYCLPFKQVSILRHLQNEESWITWEPGKENDWVRQPPPWAITSDPALHYPGEMNYQTFCKVALHDGIHMVGVRAMESIQRMKYIARSKMDGTAGGMYKVYPIYDWKDTDVWLFIKEYNLDFPESYMDLYAVGQNRGNLRMCNYFAAESIAGLRQIAEIDPQLWDKIERREPNAYLTLLYWDSEMFKRSTRKRARLEKELDKKDYKALLKDMLFRDFDITFTTHARRRVAEQYKRMYIKMDGYLKPKHYKDMYECLVAGDPKLRSIRAIWTNIGTSLSDQARAEVKSRKGAASHA